MIIVQELVDHSCIGRSLAFRHHFLQPKPLCLQIPIEKLVELSSQLGSFSKVLVLNLKDELALVPAFLPGPDQQFLQLQEASSTGLRFWN